MDRSRLRISASFTEVSEDRCLLGYDAMWSEDEIHPHWWWRLQTPLKTSVNVHQTVCVTCQKNKKQLESSS